MIIVFCFDFTPSNANVFQQISSTNNISPISKLFHYVENHRLDAEDMHDNFMRRINRTEELFAELVGRPHKVWSCNTAYNTTIGRKYFSLKEEVSDIRGNKYGFLLKF